MKRITSGENAYFKTLQRLTRSSRECSRQGLTLLDGAHLALAYRQSGGVPERVLVSDSALAEPRLQTLLGSHAADQIWTLSDALFKRLSTVETPTGVLTVIKVPRLQSQVGTSRPCVMLENIQDPGNLGSILRSAAASGIEDIYLSTHSAYPWAPRVLRAAMGAHFILKIYEDVDLVEHARSFAGRVLTSSPHAERSIYQADLRGAVAFVFGNEGAGLSQEWEKISNERIAIPMVSAMESLNLAAAAAICLFERVRQGGACASSVSHQ